MKNFKFMAMAGLVVASVSANALTLVTNRAAIGQTDFIDWGQFGATFNPVADNSMGLSNTGNTRFRVSDGDGLERRDQGNGWSGNFAQRDRLIWTRDSGSSLSLRFSNTMFAAGAQIQRDTYGAFTATIEAFDALGDSLGSFNVAGNSDGASDNSAIFVGVASAQGDIARLVYTMDGGQSQGDDFAINEVALNQCVPEPGTIAALGLGALVLLRRKRK